jgi:hypothetical protein
VGQCADVTAGIAAADFAACLDQHNAEGGVIKLEAVGNQGGIPRFENPQRQFLAGQHRPLERKHRDGRHA